MALLYDISRHGVVPQPPGRQGGVQPLDLLVIHGPMDLSTPSASGWSSIAPTVAYINFLGVTVTCYVPLSRYDSPTVAYNTY
jgi:hypothetical protein